MAHGSRICPSCGRLNGAGESRCYHCKERLPGPVLTAVLDLWKSAFGQDFPVTKLFVLINLVVFAACFANDGRLPLFFGQGFRVSTLLRWGALLGSFVPDEPWRFLSAMFVHGSLLHVGLNLLALTDLGRTLEPRFGSARFTVMFLLSGGLGFVVSYYWNALGLFSFGPLFTVGASGGIFGLLGAYVAALYARGDPEWKRALLRNGVYALVFALALPVNTPAHIGGAIVGALFGWLFEKERQPARLAWLARILAVAGVLASVGSILLANASPYWKAVRAEELYRE